MPDSYEDGVRLLARRGLTRHEVEERLAARGHAPSAIDSAVDRLTRIAAIDDAALARSVLATKLGPRGRGRERALAELRARGVDETTATRAWDEALEDGTIEPDALLTAAVRRRLGAPAGRPMGRLARVYNALLSEGFAADRIEAALAPYGFERNDEE